jgi:hypothetical protein
MHLVGQTLGFHPFVYLYGLLGGVQDHPAVRTSADVFFQMSAGLDVGGLVDILIEPPKKVLTGKQTGLPPSA